MSFQIIGLLGQAGSGKDTVADWFYRKGYVKAAFADVMKRYVNSLFLYTPEVLWGPSELRNQPHLAGDPWWMDVMSRWGRATNKFVNELFAHPFSNGHIGRVDAYLSLMQWLTDLRRYTQRVPGNLLSPRVVLQTLGTEWGRRLDPNMWTNYMYNRIVPHIMDGGFYDPERGIVLTPPDSAIHSEFPGVIIPDHRFVNEVEVTKSQGGFIIQISRPGNPKKDAPGVQGHASETQQQEQEMHPHLVLELPEGLQLVTDTLEGLFKDKPWNSLSSS